MLWCWFSLFEVKGQQLAGASPLSVAAPTIWLLGCLSLWLWLSLLPSVQASQLNMLFLSKILLNVTVRAHIRFWRAQIEQLFWWSGVQLGVVITTWHAVNLLELTADLLEQFMIQVVDEDAIEEPKFALQMLDLRWRRLQNFYTWRGVLLLFMSLHLLQLHEKLCLLLFKSRPNVDYSEQVSLLAQLLRKILVPLKVLTGIWLLVTFQVLWGLSSLWYKIVMYVTIWLDTPVTLSWSFFIQKSLLLGFKHGRQRTCLAVRVACLY